MITRENYLQEIKKVNVSAFPADLKELYEFVEEATEKGTNWTAYDEGDVRSVVDIFFEKVNYFIKNQAPAKKPENFTQQTEKLSKVTKTQVTEKDTQQKENKKPSKKVEPESDIDELLLVERIPEEIKFFRRFVSLNGKRKTKQDFRRFINALHKAIIEKRVRKTSPYSKQINYIQENLVKQFNTMSRPLRVEINDKTLLEFKEIIASEKVMPSVALMKRYISLNGKYGVKDKAANLIDAMKRAYDKGLVVKKDKYIQIFDKMYANLKRYVKNKSHKILTIEEPELNGLNGVLEGYHSVNGIEEEIEGLSSADCLEHENDTQTNDSKIMNSMDFIKMQFKTLGFTGKYREFIGDPSPGFTAMVYGLPKYGKSYLCADFAGYLARNHGKVLYVAKEEGLDFTLQEKLKEKDVAHPNLDVTGSIPESLSNYSFIFLDSVNKLGLSSQDLDTLKQTYPGKSFIYVFQTTKDGSVRGTNEYMHNVDVVIEVPEKGLAKQNGRFNQGGEMRIFDEPDYKQAA